jgi:hypothetical protein
VPPCRVREPWPPMSRRPTTTGCGFEARRSRREVAPASEEPSRPVRRPVRGTEERYILESDLRALDEALRFSAGAARWPEGDTGAEGIPPDEILIVLGGRFAARR